MSSAYLSKCRMLDAGRTVELLEEMRAAGLPT